MNYLINYLTEDIEDDINDIKNTDEIYEKVEKLKKVIKKTDDENYLDKLLKKVNKDVIIKYFLDSPLSIPYLIKSNKITPFINMLHDKLSTREVLHFIKKLDNDTINKLNKDALDTFLDRLRKYSGKKNKELEKFRRAMGKNSEYKNKIDNIRKETAKIKKEIEGDPKSKYEVKSEFPYKGDQSLWRLKKPQNEILNMYKPEIDKAKENMANKIINYIKNNDESFLKKFPIFREEIERIIKKYKESNDVNKLKKSIHNITDSLNFLSPAHRIILKEFDAISKEKYEEITNKLKHSKFSKEELIAAKKNKSLPKQYKDTDHAPHYGDVPYWSRFHQFGEILWVGEMQTDQDAIFGKALPQFSKPVLTKEFMNKLRNEKNKKKILEDELSNIIPTNQIKSFVKRFPNDAKEIVKIYNSIPKGEMTNPKVFQNVRMINSIINNKKF